MIFFAFKKVLQQGKPWPKDRARGSPREPIYQELQIQEPLWSETKIDLRQAWACKPNAN